MITQEEFIEILKKYYYKKNIIKYLKYYRKKDWLYILDIQIIENFN